MHRKCKQCSLGRTIAVNSTRQVVLNISWFGTTKEFEDATIPHTRNTFMRFIRNPISIC
uniref:Uncharacterized protein n=1 Tax=Arundo donax TaxID=35708 RepID=A0A0A9F1C8_ARUDO